MPVANLIPRAPASTVWPLVEVDHVAMAVAVAVAVAVVVMAAATVVAVTAVVAAVDARSVAEQHQRSKGLAPLI